MKTAAMTPTRRKTGAAGRVWLREAAAPKAPARAKAPARLQPPAADAPLVRADLKRPPARRASLWPPSPAQR